MSVTFGAERTSSAGLADVDVDEPRFDLLRARSKGLRLVNLASDVGTSVAAWLVVALTAGVDDPVRVVALGAGVATALLASQGLHRSRNAESRHVEGPAITRAAGASALAVAAAGLVTGPTAVVGYLALWLVVTLGRSVLRGIFASMRRRGRLVRSVVVAGDGPEVAKMVELLRARPEDGYRVVGTAGFATSAVVPHDPRTSAAPELAADLGATGVLLVGSATSADARTVVAKSHEAGLHLQVAPALLGVGPSRLVLNEVASETFCYVEPLQASPLRLAAKRVTDVVVASILLVVALPVIGVAALVILATSGRPIMFHQARMGRNGRSFRMHKLRTMVPDADQMVDGLKNENERDGGPLFKMANDPRVTRSGKFLRAVGIDELPQLWNVIRGEMSMVGPRPAMLHEALAFDDEHRRRETFRPGVTGLWQVAGEGNPTFVAFRQLDLHYVENWSLSGDLVLLGRTVAMVVRRVSRVLRGLARRNRGFGEVEWTVIDLGSDTAA